MEEERYISLFKGSVVEADQVHDYLAQNNIGSLVRNHIQENLSAGWIGPGADHAAEVFVANDDFVKAEGLLKNIFNEGITSEPYVEKGTDDPV